MISKCIRKQVHCRGLKQRPLIIVSNSASRGRIKTRDRFVSMTILPNYQPQHPTVKSMQLRSFPLNPLTVIHYLLHFSCDVCCRCKIYSPYVGGLGRNIPHLSMYLNKTVRLKFHGSVDTVRAWWYYSTFLDIKSDTTRLCSRGFSACRIENSDLKY